MTRQVNDKNQIWYEKQGEVTMIGFTNEFLNSLDQCWHILPANLDKFKLKSPLLTIETNDALVSILAPVAGNFMEFSDKAQNFPNKLVESDVVIRMSSAAQVRVNTVQRQAIPPAPARPTSIADIIAQFRAEAVMNAPRQNQVRAQALQHAVAGETQPGLAPPPMRNRPRPDPFLDQFFIDDVESIG